MKVLTLFAVLAAVSSTGFAARVVCYYANWSRYGEDPFKIEDINPKLCTHIVYAYFGLENNGAVTSADPWNDFGDDWTVGGVTRFVDLKKQNPQVKLLLGVGGWNEGASRFQIMVRNPEYRKNFIQSSVAILSKYGFDGLDIDWIYQDSWGGTPEVKAGVSTLVKEINDVFKKKGYVLGFATSANPTIFKNSYDIPVLSKYVDFINVLSYDLHGSWNGKTGHVAPLFAMKGESPEDLELNVAAAIERHLKAGASPASLNVGLVAYGRTFTLRDPNTNGVNAPTTGPGREEPLHYKRFCLQDKDKVWKKFRIPEQKVPYAVAKNQWVGYEDEESLTEKVKFGKSKKLGGVTFWNLDQDDFKGRCGPSYPLLQAVNKEINRRGCPNIAGEYGGISRYELHSTYDYSKECKCETK